MRTLVLVSLLLSGLLAGCDSYAQNLRFDGQVVDAVSGEPIEGIFMTLRAPSAIGAGTIVASDITDAEGRYWIRYRGINVTVYANLSNFGEDGPENPNYYWQSVDSEDGNVRLGRSDRYED